MPEETLLAFADHGEVDLRCRATAATPKRCWSTHSRAGIDVDALARQLQDEGAKGFVESWNDLLGAIEAKSKALA